MTEPLEDLMVKARRGTLSAEQRRRLTLGLNASLEANLLYQAGCGFERLPVVEAEDEAFLDRVASAATERFGQSMPVARHRPSRVAVAIYFVSAVAAAGGLGRLYHVVRSSASHRVPPTAVSTGTVAHPVVSVAPPKEAGPQAVEAVATTASGGPAASRTAPNTRSVPQPIPRGPLTPKPETAQSLFALGNALRSEGRTADAMRVYQRLEQAFANSREAGLATMSHGLLELQRGQPAAALALFRQAHRARPSPEALWGEAQSLRQLGNLAQERQVLEALLRQYPASAYAPTATKRLETQD